MLRSVSRETDISKVAASVLGKGIVIEFWNKSEDRQDWGRDRLSLQRSR
jgi:hypothetical protein